MCWHQHIKHNDVICKELILKQRKPQTYQGCGLSSSNTKYKSMWITCKHSRYRFLRICIPSFYWLPKLHKNPCGNRFIAASNACSTKPLSQLLTACLTWTTIRSVKNGFSITVIQIITINKSGQAECFDSYDFSTLYISIPHQLCKRELVMKAFLKSALELLI